MPESNTTIETESKRPNPFIEGFRYMFSVPDFRGSNRAVWGRIHRGEESDTFVINFTPKLSRLGRTIDRVTNPKKIQEALRQGSQDLLELLSVLESDEKFRNVKVISGTTNYSMAKFAIKYLGFHIYHDPKDTRTDEQIMEDARQYEKISPQKRHWMEARSHGLYHGPSVTVQISRDDLLAQRENIERIAQRVHS